MDDKKIIKLDIKKADLEQKQTKQPINHSFLQTNPILQRMLTVNSITKKSKFNFKDLFR